MTSALTQILPEHAHLVKGGVPSVEILSDEEDNLPAARLSDEEDIIFLKSNNISDPNARCRDQAVVEGLDTGAWAAEEELQGWIEVGSPPSTAVHAAGVGKGLVWA